MKPNLKRRTLLSGLLASGLMQGCGGGGGDTHSSTLVQNGTLPETFTPPTSTLAPQDGPGIHPSPNSNLPVPSLNAIDGKPLFIAHRGAAAVYPEMTYTAYDGCIRDGQLNLECDVFTLADGTLAVIHDDTVDRTTSESGPVVAYTKQTWNSLRIDADNWHGSRFGNRLAAVQFTSWVKRYKGTSLLVPEAKDGPSMSAMLAILASERVRKDQVLLQSFRMASVQQAAEAGYQACALATLGGPQAALASGATWAGVWFGISDADLRTWTNTRLNILLWTVNRRYIRDAKLLLGVKGFFSDDPTYLSANLPLYTTDRFESGTWAPGMLANSVELISPARGKFIEGGYWGYDSISTAYQGCLQGYLCPIKGEAKPTSYSVEFNIRFGAVLNGDVSRWASVYIGTDDREFIDSNEESAGYHFLFRKSGSIEIFMKRPGSRASPLGAHAGTAFSEGDEGRFRIQVSGTTIKLSRLSADNSEAYSVTVKDQTYRGAYLTLGRNGLECAFRRVIVS